MTAATLSPEARTLLQKAQDWLVGKNPHWVRGTFGRVIGRDGEEIDIEDIEGVHPDYWRNYEYEKEWFDEEEQDYKYEVVLPFESVTQPTNGCLLTGLLVANNYEQDRAFYEARDFLAELAAKSDKTSDLHLRQEDPENAIISWNDNASRTIGDVRNLFRRAFYRLGRRS